MYWMTESVEVSHVPRFNLEVIPVLNVDTELLGNCFGTHAVIGFLNRSVVESEKPAGVLEVCIMKFSSVR